MNNNAAKAIPTIVVLGHVDHGKTTLLDAIRGTSVQKSEPMGITQNIYVSEVDYKGFKMTFVDTPGHEVFSLMRMQGGQVADLALLIVAADEGVKPQTKESLEIIKQEQLKFIVVITKMDAKGADPQKVINELLQEGVYLEGYGGDIPVVQVSAVKRQGIDKLLETIQLYIEVEGILDPDLNRIKLDELLSTPELVEHVKGYGIVLDSAIDKHTGTTAFVIWRLGEFTSKDVGFIGESRVRFTRMLDANRQPLKEIYPGKAVIFTGLDELPNPGDIVVVPSNERQYLKSVSGFIKGTDDKQNSDAQDISEQDFLEQFFAEQEEEKTIVPLIIKFDVEASKRSVLQYVDKYNTEHVEFKIIKAEVGEVSASDIDLARDFKAIVIGFRVPIKGRIRKMAQSHDVDLQEFDTVYNLFEYLHKHAENIEERFRAPEPVGKARVVKIFELSDGSIVAGSIVLGGIVKRNAYVRVLRGDNIAGEFDIVDLRRFKERVAQVSKGQECGINLGKNVELKEGDILEVIPKGG